ncbi:MAG TPA: hypothetical protein VGD63_11725 [Steroidobacteraceae bacterium]
MQRKSKLKLKRIRKPRVRARLRPVESAVMTGLSQELYNVITDAVVALGVSPAIQKQALELAMRERTRRRPSETVLKVHNELALLLATWRRDSRFVQPDGTPKALPILGKGATLESLVKFCVPDLDVAQVVEILCTHSDVSKLKGDKVALLGNPVMITEKTPAAVLAWLIWQVRHLAETVVFNAKIPASARLGGRFERQVYGRLPKKEFEAWAHAVRKRLQETSDRVEQELEAAGGGRGRGDEKLCGIGLYVFREDGDLG